MTGTEFKFFVPMLKASQSTDGKMRLHGVASSTVADRHGDVMNRSALEDMLESANRGLTIFLNHSYNVPEDVAGTVERATLRQATGDIHDLSFDIIINDKNPRAVGAWEAIQNGTQLGLSIGAMIPDGGAKVDRKSGSFMIDHVDLVETSIVGVPANPRSWVEYAVKALRKSEPELWLTNTSTATTTASNAAYDTTFTFVTESHSELPDSAFACIDSKGRHYPHHTASGSLDLPLLRNALARIADKSNTQCGKGHLLAHARAAGVGDHDKAVDPDIIESLDEVEGDEGLPPETDGTVEIEVGGDGPEAIEAVALAQNLANAGVDVELNGNTIEPEKADATVTVETPLGKVTVDTGNRGTPPAAASNPTSQDAPASTPENESAASDTPPWLGVPGNPPAKQSVEETDLASFSPLITASLRHATDLVTSLTSELVEVKAVNARLTQEAIEARSDRDESVREAIKALRELDTILKRLANTPLGRKSVYHEAVGRYEAIKAVYGDEFAAMLARSNE